MILTLSPHAVSRMVEFGIGEDVVAEIVGRPSVRYPSRRNHARGDVYQSSAHPTWAVVADPPDVITVLRRTAEQWQHETTSTASLRVFEDDRCALSPPAPPVTRRRISATATVPRSAVRATVVDPLVLVLAHQLADDDLRRLVINPDGTVTVLNRPRGARG